jgi:hypothetical protein
MFRFLALAVCVLSAPAWAVVIRHDVPDAKYRIVESNMPALVSLAHEGHGVLIAPQWILTAAHATQWHPVSEVMLGDRCLKVEKLIVHPGYKKLPDELLKGDAAPAMVFMAQSDDIALIKLAEPLTDIRPVGLYERHDETGKLMRLVGMGATGNGKDGQHPHGQHRTQLRHAFNTIDSADTRWLSYSFDSDERAHPLEGMGGNGDSGGPILIEDNGQWKVAGLTSWTFATGPVGSSKPGIYGTKSHIVRVSQYVSWIRKVMSADQP